MSKKLSYKLLAFLLLAVLLCSYATAIGLGISPGALNYRNVLRGGYAQQTIIVSSFIAQNLSMTFEFGGDTKEWIVIEDNITNVTLGPNEPRQLKVKIYPPTDTPNGNYTGSIRIVTDKVIDPETGVGSSIRAAFQINVYISVTGDQIQACSGGGISINDIETGFPLVVSSTIVNEGNVRINPSMLLDIYDKYQTTIAYSSSKPTIEVLPTETESTKNNFDINLPEEQYWARVRIPDCNLDSILTFNVLGKGGISDKGELIRVENKPWAQEGEIIPITAVFRNDGQRTVSAKFKGEVLYNGEVVKVIDTDSLDASPGEVVSLQSFFKPDTTGQYYIRGKVYFNNKLTGEKASVLNVNESAGGTLSVSRFLIYMGIIAIVAAILVMLIMIEKKKKRMKRR